MTSLPTLRKQPRCPGEATVPVVSRESPCTKGRKRFGWDDGATLSQVRGGCRRPGGGWGQHTGSSGELRG